VQEEVKKVKSCASSPIKKKSSMNLRPSGKSKVKLVEDDEDSIDLQDMVDRAANDGEEEDDDCSSYSSVEDDDKSEGSVEERMDNKAIVIASCNPKQTTSEKPKTSGAFISTASTSSGNSSQLIIPKRDSPVHHKGGHKTFRIVNKSSSPVKRRRKMERGLSFGKIEEKKEEEDMGNNLVREEYS
jgi:hypothetical protein